jgi:hypothetical protein
MSDLEERNIFLWIDTKKTRIETDGLVIIEKNGNTQQISS